MRIELILGFVSLLLVPGLVLQAAEPRPSRARECRVVVDGQATFETFTTRTKAGVEIPIDGVLMKPSGAGPLPALVLLHGAPGIMPPDCYRHAQERFADWGYATLLVDSFSARHPSRNRFGAHSFEDQARDGLAARAFLATRPFVDADRIGFVGWSKGGGATLAAVTGRVGIVNAGKRPFRVAAAFYPFCLGGLGGLQAPLLVMIGENDEETPAANCKKMASAGGMDRRFELRVYPNTRHAFDFPGARRYKPEAAEEAFETLKRFLQEHLQ